MFSTSETKTLQFHSQPNCFLYLDGKLKEKAKLTENDIIEITYKNNHAFFSLLFLSQSLNDSLYLNCTYAKQLGLNELDQVHIHRIHRNHTSHATSITIEPISLDDWEILELNLDDVQDNLLHQLKVVYPHQKLPIWIDKQLCVFVRVIAFEPKINEFTSINSLTRVNVQPINPRNDEKCEEKGSSMEWTCMVEADSSEDVAIKCQNDFTRCSSLTTVEIGQKYLKEIGIDTHTHQKYLVQIDAIRSPMQSLKTQSSSFSTTKKFLNSIQNSYPPSYNTDAFKSACSIYAILNVTNEQNSVLHMSEFLRRQLCLYKLSAKCVINASCLNKFGDSNLSRTNVKSVKLRTDSKINAEDIKKSFIEFIDQNSECLCPIILTDNMRLELFSNDELITCCVTLPQKFTAIYSTLVLHDLLDIEVDHVKSIYSLPSINSLQSSLFSINVHNSKWFQYNVDQVMTHLSTNLYSSSGQFKPRNLVIRGMKGAGKSTLLKYICNQVCTQQGTLYQYINCQNFMNKTADTIYDQLRLIYQQCIWSRPQPCIVVLENLDLLIENKSHTVDPSSQLYHAQIVESLKDLLNSTWDNPFSRVVTIVTVSCPISEMPALFHCIDDHGLFSEFSQIRSHSIKEETTEIINAILAIRGASFEADLIEAILCHSDGFVYKDIEKLIDQIMLINWSGTGQPEAIALTTKNTRDVVYNYTCMNMLETKFYKAKSQLSWNLIGGLTEIKNSLIETLIWPIKYKKIYHKLGMKESAGVLLYGPSGCGKTLIASTLANESKFNFISIKGPELLSKYIGNSEQNVRELFTKAQAAKPCIIFFDEFESLAPKRGHDSTGVTDRVVNQLLTQLDGVEQLDGVYLLAATSRPDLIDKALLRPGRIDSALCISYPQKEAISDIFKLYCNEMKLKEDVDFEALSLICQDLTGADIKAVVCDALLRGFHRVSDVLSGTEKSEENGEQMLRNMILIEQADFVTSIETIKETVNLNERKKLKRMYENWSLNRTFSDPVGSKIKYQPKATLA